MQKIARILAPLPPAEKTMTFNHLMRRVALVDVPGRTERAMSMLQMSQIAENIVGSTG